MSLTRLRAKVHGHKHSGKESKDNQTQPVYDDQVL